ncbi:MAG: endonuclease domain-containing protein [Clostridiales bacterium]|nr:endonuclease domain-containing protein [Clostridiales bacterium]
MNQTSNRQLTGNAKTLRKNMTKEERHLWYDFLKDCPFTVNRQKVIGHYIVDFYCAQGKLVIELDGSQHYEEEGEKADMIRDAYLRSLGLTVLRYSNLEIKQNFEGVCMDILAHVPQK